MLFIESFGASGAHPLFVLLGALVLDGLIGDMPQLFERVPHPVVLIGHAVTWLDRRLNREQRSERARWVRGVIAVAALVAAAGIAGVLIHLFCRALPFGWLIELFLIGILLAQRNLFEHVQAVATGLSQGGLPGGRAAIRHIVGRDPMSLDDYGVARAGIESLAENFSDGVVAPVFWTLLGGLPGLLIYKTANTLDSMIGHLSPRYRSFGWAAARLDDVLNLVPARLSGLLIATAALLAPEAHSGHALRIMLRDARKHRSPNAGWPEAAMAGALDLALAGPRRYAEQLVDDPWLGEGRARVTPADMHRALQIYVIACVLQAAIVFVLWQAMAEPMLFSGGGIAV